MLRLTLWFPLLAVVISLVAAAVPDFLITLRPAIVPLLGVVMFGMGMTLTPGSFADVVSRPRIVALGLVLQYMLMPFWAWSTAQVFGLPEQLALGLVLVGSCPGGTASNVMCYLAKGDVALSISLTTLSTLLAVVATPLLTWIYMGQSIPVPVWGMILSIVKVIVVPVALGVAVNTWFGSRMGSIKRLFPLLSISAILLIIGIIVAINHPHLAGLAVSVVAAIVVHNLAGLAGGYWVARWLGLDSVTSRTLSLEVGMQNSGLGVALAVQHFSAIVAVPGALFSVWHNLSGAALASLWARTPSR